MKFRSTLLRAAATAALSLLLASCGGESLVAFVPERVLVFGDEASVITLEAVPSQGKKYTINALNTDGTFACGSNQLWIQVLASSYGIGFPECPGPTSAGAAATAGRILAKPGATASGTLAIDLAQQITQQLNKPVADGGGISANDLVTVYIGVNDVVEAYKRYEAGATQAEVSALADASGVAIAAQVARIAAAGGRVIVSTVPDVGATPYGRSKDVAGTALLTFLTGRINSQFLLELQNSGNNNGREIGLIELNPYLLNVIAFPASYGYVNAVEAACKDLPLPPNCTTLTLRNNPDGTPAGAFNWLWSNELQLSPGGHLQLGSLASTRARNQPF